MQKKNNVFTLLQSFFKNDSASGFILLFCAIVAMIVANSNLATAYNNILQSYITIGYKEFSLSMSVLHWINDGLMAIFFLVVGMEIKRELAIGELKSLKKAILPVSAALGGMIVPAAIYLLFNYHEPTQSGWAIPMATDIAFALGILSLIAKNAPKGIVVFLAALAIIDDLGAVIVIAIFYTSKITWIALIAAAITFAALLLANRLKVKYLSVFVVGGIILWFCLLKSGVHATVAGVLFGMSLPVGKDITEYKTSLLHRLEHTLAPWSAFLVMPIFAFANAGVTIDISNLSTILVSPVSLGIFFGLFIGKQVGIFGVSYLMIKLKIANLPSRVTIKHLYGVSILGGIGFTMSLFITSLSFADASILATAKLAIILSSLLAGVTSAVYFKLQKPQPEPKQQAEAC